MNTTVATLPRLAVRMNGRTIGPDELVTLVGMLVQHRLSQPSMCELTFEGETKWLRPGDLPIGGEVEVSLGESGDSVFSGEITAIEVMYEALHCKRLRVRAYDRLHRLRKKQDVCVRSADKVSDIARDICGGVGLNVSTAADAPVPRTMIQAHESDLAFLARVAEVRGLYLALRDATVHIISLAGTSDSTVALELGRELHEARFEANADGAVRSVKVVAWDPQTVQRHEGHADGARTGRNATAEASPQKFGAKGEVTLVGRSAPNDDAATALAQGELDRRSCGEVVFTGTADGDARLLPGTKVRIANVADTFAGTYALTAVRHRFDLASGFTTEMSSAPPARAQCSSTADLLWATVTAVNDPDGLGRVKCKLSSMGDVATDWLPVLAPGAGGNKGLVALPDVGDEVLVFTASADPAVGIVLGGLFGKNSPGDYGVDHDRVKRFSFLTPGGQKVRMNDLHGSVRLENKAGSFVELAPERVTVHAATDLVIEAPARSITIRANAVDIQRA